MLSGAYRPFIYGLRDINIQARAPRQKRLSQFPIFTGSISISACHIATKIEYPVGCLIVHRVKHPPLWPTLVAPTHDKGSDTERHIAAEGRPRAPHRSVQTLLGLRTDISRIRHALGIR